MKINRVNIYSKFIHIARLNAQEIKNVILFFRAL